MTPHEKLNGELKILMNSRYGLAFYEVYNRIDFWYGWYSDHMVVIRLFKDARLIDQFSYKIVTMEDVSDFRKVFAKKIAKYSKEEKKDD
jgi:hypothetical protein